VNPESIGEGLRQDLQDLLEATTTAIQALDLHASRADEESCELAGDAFEALRDRMGKYTLWSWYNGLMTWAWSLLAPGDNR